MGGYLSFLHIAKVLHSQLARHTNKLPAKFEINSNFQKILTITPPGVPDVVNRNEGRNPIFLSQFPFTLYPNSNIIPPMN